MKGTQSPARGANVPASHTFSHQVCGEGGGVWVGPGFVLFCFCFRVVTRIRPNVHWLPQASSCECLSYLLRHMPDSAVVTEAWRLDE